MTDDTTTDNAQPTLLAGKYEDQEGLERGIRELAASLDKPIPEDQQLIGDNGMFANVDAAVDGYRAFSRLQRRQGDESVLSKLDKNGDSDPENEVDEEESDEPLEIAPPDIEDDDDIQAILEKTGLEAKDLTDQWMENGKLTDDQYERLRNAGFPKGVVNTYMAGEQARAEAIQSQSAQYRQTASDMVGGEKQLNNLLKWAGSTLSEKEQKVMNQRLGDPDLFEGAIAELNARYASAVGDTGGSKTIQGKGGTPSSSGILGTKEYWETMKLANRGNPDAREKLRRHIAAGGKRRL